jgi:hypothetical protein
MRQFFLLLTLAISSTIASFGQEVDTTCFLGMNVSCSAKGVILSKSLILLERIQNPATKQITINTMLIDTTGKVTKNPTMILLVDENNEFTVFDPKKTTSGKGKLFGPSWNWTYMSGDYKTAIGVTIKDQDFFSDPSIFTSRKEISLPNGAVVLTIDISATKISKTEYEILVKAIKLNSN